MDSSSAYGDGLTEMGRLIMENEKAQRKLCKIQQRRDHYARLYYKTLAELDETKWELTLAKNKIRELQAGQHHRRHRSDSNTTSPDSGTSLSPSVLPISHSAHSWREQPPGPLPQPKPVQPRGFTRSLSLSHRDTSRGTVTQDIAPPQPFQRQLSVPRSFPSSKSMSTLSAFQPPKPKAAPFPVSSKCSPSQTSRVSLTPTGEVRCEHMTGLEMLDLLSQISSSNCTIHTLEIANSQLGEPEAMRVFCEDLVKNRSITSLSLPDNGIGSESLAVLLEAVQECSHMKELLLRNNHIGIGCVEIIKGFLSQTTLDSLVLTGNEIEHHSHLLGGELPREFSMEYGTSWDSGVDSGVAIREQKSKHSVGNSLDYMHV